MPVKVSEREYRDIDLMMECRAMEDGQEVVEGYATTWDEYLLWDDGEYRMYERFDPHAYDECDMSDVILQLNHEGRVYARGGNKTLTVGPDAKGLHTLAYLGGTEAGRQLKEEVKGGYLTKMSQGFRVAEQRREVVENTAENRIDIHRLITKVAKLYDVSIVSLPANEATSISARSVCEGVIAEVKQERLAIEAQRKTKEQIAILADSI